MRAGRAESKNAFVEAALKSAVKEAKRLERRARWRQAARDPLFLADIAAVDADFAAADAEIVRGMD